MREVLIMTIMLLAAIVISFILTAVGQSPSGSVTPVTVEAYKGWGKIRSPRTTIYRLETPNGWLVQGSDSLIYVPDPNGLWLTEKPEKE